VPISADAVTQGQLLASILAGFSLATSSQLAGARHDMPLARVVVALHAISGIIYLGSVWVGILFFANEGDLHHQQILNDAFFLMLTGGVVFFLLGLVLNFWELPARYQHVRLLGGNRLALLILGAILLVTFLVLFFYFGTMVFTWV
jgi:hypothetical protein